MKCFIGLLPARESRKGRAGQGRGQAEGFWSLLLRSKVRQLKDETFKKESASLGCECVKFFPEI